MLPGMPLHMTDAELDAIYADMSRWPWLDENDSTSMPGYRHWFLNGPDTCMCPCCGKTITVKGLEALLYWGVRKALTIPVGGQLWAEDPQFVTCVDAHGHRVCRGFAQTFRCHAGPIDIWVSMTRDNWRRGRWWPLNRVAWEIKTEQ
jgi:hypothetical protein